MTCVLQAATRIAMVRPGHSRAGTRVSGLEKTRRVETRSAPHPEFCLRERFQLHPAIGWLRLQTFRSIRSPRRPGEKTRRAGARRCGSADSVYSTPGAEAGARCVLATPIVHSHHRPKN